MWSGRLYETQFLRNNATRYPVCGPAITECAGIRDRGNRKPRVSYWREHRNLFCRPRRG